MKAKLPCLMEQYSFFFDPLNRLITKVKLELGDEFCDADHILRACNSVMKEEGFTGDILNYYNVENCYVNESLKNKTGIPITLCTIFDALTRAVGLKIEPIGSPTHFLMKYGSTYIDPFNNQLLNRNQAIELIISAIGPQLGINTTQNDKQLLYREFEAEYLSTPAPLKSIFQRMLNNILSYSRRTPMRGIAAEEHVLSLLSLSLLLDESNHKDRLSRLEMLVGMGDIEAIFKEVKYIKEHFDEIRILYNANALNRFLDQIERVAIEIAKQRLKCNATERPAQKRRLQPDSIIFKVGDIIRHKRYGYRGVIFGHDPICGLGEDWQRQMRVDELPHGANQPFYNVMVDDRDRPNQVTYVAQENIQCLSIQMDDQEEVDTRGGEIQHDEIGKYFSKFDAQNFRYIPNEFTKYQYPDD
jgi:hemimethylated DNA binding protein